MLFALHQSSKKDNQMNSISIPSPTPTSPFGRITSAYKEILSDEARLWMNNEAIRLNQKTIEEGAHSSICMMFPNLTITDEQLENIKDADLSDAWGFISTAQPATADSIEEFSATVINYILTKARHYSVYGVDVEDYVRGINLALMIHPKNIKFTTPESLEAAIADLHTVEDAVDELERWLAITDGQSLFGHYIKANPAGGEREMSLEE